MEKVVVEIKGLTTKGLGCPRKATCSNLQEHSHCRASIKIGLAYEVSIRSEVSSPGFGLLLNMDR